VLDPQFLSGPQRRTQVIPIDHLFNVPREQVFDFFFSITFFGSH
jgi:hypothetical protein